MKSIPESEIIEVVKQRGILTGSELSRELSADVFSLWRSCRLATELCVRTFGRRYLRLDKGLENYARLSPSIMREFLTYTLVGMAEEDEVLDLKAKEREEEIRLVSRSKHDLAYDIASEAMAQIAATRDVEDRVCFIIAGDVVFDMAHTEPRPEKSTGKMVRGSDLDLIVVYEDDLAEEIVQELDRAFYERKYLLLVHPLYREELDYIIKPLSKVKQQVAFDNFAHMVACKILDEGRMLTGSKELFGCIKRLLDDNDIPSRLSEMEDRARARRDEAEHILLGHPGQLTSPEFDQLFYYREEADEIF